MVLNGIKKAYNDKTVFSDYSLQVDEGSVCSVMGSSGCGKTTLLRLIAGLEKADAGTITGVPDRIGMVFQEDRLCEELNALDNVRLVLAKNERKNRAQSDERMREHFARVAFPEESLTLPVRMLSGGMRRRVAVVRAMMSPGELLLLDEPCTGLDVETGRLVINYVLWERNDRTLVVVTHSEKEAEQLGGEKIFLKST